MQSEKQQVRQEVFDGPAISSNKTLIKLIKKKLKAIPRDEKGLVLLEHTTGKMRSNKFGK